MVRVQVENVARKPWGFGKAAVLKHRRNSLALSMSEYLLERLDEDRVSMTGQLFPRGTLKKRANRVLFDWVHYPEFGGRTFTKPVLRLVVKKLMKRITLPLDPENTRFVSQQTARLRRLVKSAKRLKAWMFRQKKIQ